MSENDFWIQTYTGKRFRLLNPQPLDVSLEDIAVALSRLCRFGGHTSSFYSVAQHSVLVANLVPSRLKMQALLHDAAEAYVGDVTKPLKAALGARYEAIEAGVARAIGERFGVNIVPKAPEVEIADLCMLAAEARDLMSHPVSLSFRNIEPAPDRVVPVDEVTACHDFLEAFGRFG